MGPLSLPLMGSWDVATQQYVAAMTTPPSTPRVSLINQLVRSLKFSGVWSKLDALYLLAAHDAQAARLNAVAPGTFTASAVNGPTFAADRGYTSDGVTSNLNLNFNRQTAGLKYALESAHFSAWVNTNVSVDVGAVGVSTAAANPAFVLPRTTTNTALARVNTTTSISVASITDSRGLSSANRSGATTSALYKNGVAIGTDNATATVALNSDNFLALGAGAGFYTGRVAAVSVGASLSAAEQLALYDALNVYLTALGAAS